MKKFVFSLEKLLRIREHLENEWEVNLGKAVSACNKIENEIRHNYLEIDRMIELGCNNKLSQDYLLSMDIYRRRMDKEIKKLKIDLEKAEIKREEVRKEYLESSKNRKIISKLKEKREKGYYKEQKKIEFNEMDEINSGIVITSAINEVNAI